MSQAAVPGLPAGEDHHDAVLRSVERAINRKIGRHTLWLAGFLVIHSFVAGKLWSNMTNDVEDNREDIVEMTTIQQKMIDQLDEISDEQIKRTASIEAISEIKGELKSMNANLQHLRDEVTAMKVRLERSDP